jgi:metal-responsive CopG/Arc/MetJ family transcriptional regulator
MVKVTFSLDDETVNQLRRTAARLGRPQSQVVRQAVAEYAARSDRLSERERQQMLSVLEQIGTLRPTRSARAVDEEITAIRTARKAAGRRSP